MISSEIFWRPLWAVSGMGRGIHSLKLSIQHFLCWPQQCHRFCDVIINISNVVVLSLPLRSYAESWMPESIITLIFIKYTWSRQSALENFAVQFCLICCPVSLCFLLTNMISIHFPNRSEINLSPLKDRLLPLLGLMTDSVCCRGRERLPWNRSICWRRWNKSTERTMNASVSFLRVPDEWTKRVCYVHVELRP